MSSNTHRLSSSLGYFGIISWTCFSSCLAPSRACSCCALRSMNTVDIDQKITVTNYAISTVASIRQAPTSTRQKFPDMRREISLEEKRPQFRTFGIDHPKPEQPKHPRQPQTLWHRKERKEKKKPTKGQRVGRPRNPVSLQSVTFPCKSIRPSGFQRPGSQLSRTGSIPSASLQGAVDTAVGSRLLYYPSPLWGGNERWRAWWWMSCVKDGPSVCACKLNLPCRFT